MKKHSSGQIIVIVLIILILVAMFVPILINLVRQEALWSVKQKKSSFAFNLAEAAVERGVWKIKESTSTFTSVLEGNTITNYNFDKIYADIEGGVYRINITSGASSKELIIYGEGKDNKEIRAIKCIFKNQSLPGAIVAKGMIILRKALEAHWGPIMSHDTIEIETGAAAQDYFPRKYSKQVVICNQSGNERDENGLDPPNTDNIEWWSDYNVPDFPVLDFTALSKSADNTSTHNVYGCSKMTSGISGTPWWGSSKCNGPGGSNHNGLKHFQTSWTHPDARKNYVWYWDDDVTLTGGDNDNGCGIIGTVVAKKNLTVMCGDNLFSVDQSPSNLGIGLGAVPSDAYLEYNIIKKTGASYTYDTSAVDQYPADNGLHANRSTFNFGGETWTDAQNPPAAADTDIGIKGFVYVGGDYNIEQYSMDIYGAIWAVGNVTSSKSGRTIVFFNENLEVPTMNTVLVKTSWEETVPSTLSW